jgi:hypothetical protein
MRIRLPAGIAEGAVAYAVRLLGRLLDDLGAAGLHPLEGVVEVLGGQDAGVDGRRVQDDGRAVVMREEARVHGDVHGGHASCGSLPTLLDS